MYSLKKKTKNVGKLIYRSKAQKEPKYFLNYL